MVACPIFRQCEESLSKPADSPGKPLPVTSPKPNADNVSCMDLGDRFIAILIMPTLLDLASTVVSEIAPRLCLSGILLMPTFTNPGDVSMMVLAWYRPDAMPAAAMNGLMLEPGSKMSVAARLR